MATRKHPRKKLTLTQKQKILECSVLRRNIEQIESVALTALNTTYYSDGASGQILQVPSEEIRTKAYHMVVDSLSKLKKLTDRLVALSLEDGQPDPIPGSDQNSH